MLLVAVATFLSHRHPAAQKTRLHLLRLFLFPSCPPSFRRRLRARHPARCRARRVRRRVCRRVCRRVRRRVRRPDCRYLDLHVSLASWYRVPQVTTAG